MSGSEYKAIRERLGLTQALFGAEVGRSRKIINEREQSDEVPKEAALAAELLALRETKRLRKGTNAKDMPPEPAPDGSENKNDSPAGEGWSSSDC